MLNQEPFGPLWGKEERGCEFGLNKVYAGVREKVTRAQGGGPAAKALEEERLGMNLMNKGSFLHGHFKA